MAVEWAQRRSDHDQNRTICGSDTGDFDKLNAFIPENAVWHVTGNSDFAGDYKSRMEVYAYFGKLMERTGGTFKAELIHIIGDDEYAVAIQKSTAMVDDHEVATRDVLVSRVEGDTFVETWTYNEDDSILDKIAE